MRGLLTFRGRRDRLSYILVSLATLVISTCYTILVSDIFQVNVPFQYGYDGPSKIEKYLDFLFLGDVWVGIIMMIYVWIATSIQRLHDMGLSGWFLLVTFVPVIGNIFGMIIVFAPSEDTKNRFGPVPTNGYAADMP